MDPATGSVAAVGPLGVAVADYFQRIDFDNNTGVLHAWLYLGSNTTQYSSIDVSTGRATTFPGGTVPGALRGRHLERLRARRSAPSSRRRSSRPRRPSSPPMRALRAAKKHGSAAAVKKAKKKLKKAKKKLHKAAGRGRRRQLRMTAG